MATCFSAFWGQTSKTEVPAGSAPDETSLPACSLVTGPRVAFPQGGSVETESGSNLVSLFIGTLTLQDRGPYGTVVLSSESPSPRVIPGVRASACGFGGHTNDSVHVTSKGRRHLQSRDRRTPCVWDGAWRVARTFWCITSGRRLSSRRTRCGFRPAPRWAGDVSPATGSFSSRFPPLSMG